MAVSPSKLDNAAGCLRQAAFELLNPKKFEQGPEAALGDEVHDGMEFYQKAGKNPSENEALSPLARELCVLALPYALQPRRGQSEGWFRWKWDGIEFSGRDDGNGVAEDIANAPADAAGLPATIDYKTTGDPSYGVWGKLQTPPAKGHLQDRQSIIYAKRRLELTGAGSVFHRWLYIRTGAKKGKPKQAAPSDAILEKAEVDEAFERVVMPIARALDAVQKRAAKRTLDVFQLPPNPNHCMKYARRDATKACPYIEQCNITAEQQLEAAANGGDEYMSESTLSSLTAILRAEQPGAPTFVAPASAPVFTAQPTFNPAPRMAAPSLVSPVAPPAAVAQLVAAQPALVAPRMVTEKDITPQEAFLGQPAPALVAPSLVAPILAAPKFPAHAPVGSTLVAPTLQQQADADQAPTLSPAFFGGPHETTGSVAVDTVLAKKAKAAVAADEAQDFADAELGRAVRLLLAAFKAA